MTTTKIAQTVEVERLDIRLNADPSRVLLRPYATSGPIQANHVLTRLLAMTEEQVSACWQSTLAEFGQRHRDYQGAVLRRFRELVHPVLPHDEDLSEARRCLLGAAFSMEYSLECAALFNPSIVPHPDQSGVAAGSLRFVLSLRATGEGHVSSITFREGAIDAAGEVTMEPGHRHVTGPQAAVEQRYEAEPFFRMLGELGLCGELALLARTELSSESFTFGELEHTLRKLREMRRGRSTEADNDLAASERVLSLARSNLSVSFPAEVPIGEQTLFPFTPSQCNGIEDARFVRFEDGTYYGTYTAYDGRNIMPQMVATRDFRDYRFLILSGAAVQNKGMALFPRKVNGLYTMLGRQDGENCFFSQSEDLRFWSEKRLMMRPKFPWEMVQVGNCGSPIETDAGWLLLTHGVGATRKYSIGVVLLDKDDPSKVIGRLPEPILSPNADEREGYVPNVVYTCGGITHGDHLIVPYALSDSASRFARIKLKELLNAML